MYKLINALNGPRGVLDCWLEGHNEDEVRAAILELIGPQESLRDRFAGKAMQGILSNPYWNQHAPFNPKDVAKAARDYADAMLKVLEE